MYLTSVNHSVATRTFVLAVGDDELAYLMRKWMDSLARLDVQCTNNNYDT